MALETFSSSSHSNFIGMGREGLFSFHVTNQWETTWHERAKGVGLGAFTLASIVVSALHIILASKGASRRLSFSALMIPPTVGIGAIVTLMGTTIVLRKVEEFCDFHEGIVKKAIHLNCVRV